MSKFELWSGKGDIGGLTFLPSENVANMLKSGLIGDDPEKIWEVQADSWNEACTLYHEYMGWEPYVPFDERIK